jgi:hypothetical protein
VRWPYNKRADAAHAWGAIGAGAAGLLGISAILATVNGAHPGFHWWWPTNWMAVPLTVLAFGVILLVVPLRRSGPALGPGTAAVGSSAAARVKVSQQLDNVLDDVTGVDAKRAGPGADVSVQQQAREVRGKLTGAKIDELGS